MICYSEEKLLELDQHIKQTVIHLCLESHSILLHDIYCLPSLQE